MEFQTMWFTHRFDHVVDVLFLLLSENRFPVANLTLAEELRLCSHVVHHDLRYLFHGPILHGFERALFHSSVDKRFICVESEKLKKQKITE